MSTTLTVPAIHLECIDGRDDHFRIELLPGEKKLFGGFDDESITRLKELENHGGVIIVTNENGLLKVDASDCAVPVKINGQIISIAFLKTRDILKIGNTIWKSANTSELIEIDIQTGKNSITRGFGNMLGLDELKDFSLGNLFSEVFRKHSLS